MQDGGKIRRTAVLDLGTNVFNLLLAEFSPEGCRYVKEFKTAARLGAGGLSKGYIAPEAFRTAYRAVEAIAGEIRSEGGADEIVPYATSAVRDARNGGELVRYLNESFGLRIRVISGEEEAGLIFEGVMESLRREGVRPLPESRAEEADSRFRTVVSGEPPVPNPPRILPEERILILDIGGGSNEFIVSDGKRVLWKRSFPLGMARMRERFDYREPIDPETERSFLEYCRTGLESLWEEIEKWKPSVFIGTSGSFDTFKDLLYHCRFRDWPAVELPQEALARLHGRLMRSTARERLEMPGMSSIRVDYIVLASLFTRLVLERMHPRIVCQSSYSLKEGAMVRAYRDYCRENGMAE